MARTYPFALLACLAACATPAPRPDWVVSKPALTTSLPPPEAPAADYATPEDAGAPNKTTLPVGVGMTFGPSAPMIAVGLDFPFDKQITFGPSLQYAWESDLSLASITGQLKYYFPTEEKDAKLLPYGTFGAGLVSIDKANRSGDSGLVINVGGGVRLLTGEKYSIGTELRWNWLPDEIGNEDSYFSWELVHMVITF